METRNPRIELALDVVERERSRTEAEQRAFSRFVDRLADLDVDRTVDGSGPPGHLIARGAARDRAMEQLETAYRETVMSTPEYHDGRDASFREILTVEFGRDIAATLTETEQLEPIQLRAVSRAATRSKRDRSAYLEALEDEHDSLVGIDDRLSEVERRAFETGQESIAAQSFASMRAARDALEELESTCESLVERRQEALHARKRPETGIGGRASFVGYLYDDLDVTCPALADILAVREDVRRRRRWVEDEIGRGR